MTDLVLLLIGVSVVAYVLWTLFEAIRNGWRARLLGRPDPGRAAPPTPPHPVAPAEPPVPLGPPRTVKLDVALRQSSRTLSRGAPLRILPPQQPLWAEKGWVQTVEGYTGAYQAGGRRFRGLVRQPYPGAFEAFIWHPPLRQLLRHPHGPCFIPQGLVDGRYQVHFQSTPQSLDHAISNVETILAEALGRR